MNINYNNILDKFLLLSFLLIIPALILGPAIPDILIVISSIFFLIFKFNKNEFIKYKKLIIFFSLFYFWIIISSISSDHVLWSLKSSIFYIRFLIYCLLASYLIKKYPFVIKYIFLIGLFSIIILAFDVSIQFFFKKNLIGYPASSNGYRLASFFKDEYILGSYILRVFPILIFCINFLKINKDYKFYINIFIIIISGYCIFISGDRTPLFLYIIFLILYFLVSEKKKYFLIFGAILFSILSIIILNNEDIKKRLVDQTLSELGISNIKAGFHFEKTGFFVFSPQHEKLILTGFNMFKKNKIFGVGPNNYRKNCEKKEYKQKSEAYFFCYPHPHNFYAQLLSETGIIGLLLIIITYLILIKSYLNIFYKINFKKVPESNFHQVILIISILINLFPIAPTGNFFNNNLSIFNMLSFSFLISYLYNSNSFNLLLNTSTNKNI